MAERGWTFFAVLGAAGAVAGLAVGAAIAALRPAEFRSAAVVQFLPEHHVLMPGEEAPAVSPDFLPRQMEMMRSRKLLAEAAMKGGFTSRWSLDAGAAAEIFYRSLEVEALKGTDLVSVSCRHAVAADARDMVAAVLETYRSLRTAARTETGGEKVKVLERGLAEAEVELEKLRKALAAGNSPMDLLHRDYRPGEPRISQSDQAKRDFDAALEAVSVLKLKLAAEKVGRMMKPEVLVVHEEPHPGAARSRPPGGGWIILRSVAGGLAVSLLVALGLVSAGGRSGG